MTWERYRAITDPRSDSIYARAMSQHGAAGVSPPFPSAHVLTADVGKKLFGCAGVALPIAVVLLIVALSNGSLFFSWLLFVLTAAVLGALVWAAMEMRKWGPLEAHFSTWPLELGSTTPVHLIRHSKRAVPASTLNFDVAVECEEWVRYTVGTDTRTDTNTVYRGESNAVGQLASNTFTADIEVHIPVHSGAPTFELDDNKVTWEVEIDISQLSSVSSKVSLDLIVAPVLGRSHRNIQDAPAGER